MQKRLLASLSWKAAAAVTVGALAIGTGAATSFSLIGDSHAGTDHGLERDEHATTSTSTTSTTADDESGDAAEAHTSATTAASDGEHPDNFGKVVSTDAHDGGVDGQEISELAHERNDARATARDDETATDDDKSEDADEHSQADDHSEADGHSQADDHRNDDGHEDD